MNDTALWRRKWKISIADENDEQAIDVSKLRVTFSIHRSREADHFATVKIYNLNPETERWILLNSDRIIIEAGYEAADVWTVEDKDSKDTIEVAKQYGKIFDGQIIYPARSKESNVDYVLELLCVDGNNPLNKEWEARTIQAGMNSRQIVDEACKLSKSTLPCAIISDNLSKAELPRGKVLYGPTAKQFSEICARNNATWWIEDGQLYIMKYTDPPRDEEAIVITPSTGLIGYPQQTQMGCTWNMLLNPAVHFMSLVQLKNSSMNEITAKPGSPVMRIDEEWIYQVTELTHVGDTRGEQWYTQCSGVSRYGKNAIMALMKNPQQNPGGGR